MSCLANIVENLLIVGYTDDPRTFESRVINMIYGGKHVVNNGVVKGLDGMTIESFGNADNLMIINAIKKTGGKVCFSFQEAVDFAVTKITNME